MSFNLQKVVIELDSFNLFGRVFHRKGAEIAKGLAPQVTRAFGTRKLFSGEDIRSRGVATGFDNSFKYVGWLLLYCATWQAEEQLI